jgi:hypothetical protein
VIAPSEPIHYSKCMKLWWAVTLTGLMVLGGAGCASPPSRTPGFASEQLYRANFEETWRAVQQAIISYPLRANNMDIGQIQTSSIRGSNQFKPPQELKSAAANGHRYSLTINVIKTSPKTTRVNIVKDTMVYRDFISDAEEKVSDGLEETILLYRIGREIEIEKALVRETSKKNK